MPEPVASLNTAWFSLIGVLWTGYFVLEGFDFGVGMLLPVVSRDDVDRRLCLNAIGPTWDANEVWLIAAGGATFAAFPTWYATMFSGFYLALFLVLAALIVRGVSFEFRAKRDSERWRAWWDRAQVVGSLVPAFVWGVAFTDLVHGLPLTSGGHYTGGLLGLLHPVALLGGVTTLALFALHGARFLSAKTAGDLAERAERAGRWLVLPVVVAGAGLLVWVGADASRPTSAQLPGTVPLVLGAVALLAVLASAPLARSRRDGWAFAAMTTAVAALTAAAFTALFPRVMVSTGPGTSLTIWNAASAHLTLVVMTVVAAIFTPFVLAYQAWSYHVFRARLTRPPGGRDGPVPVR
jgi:cytochrome d ubiquinol oxidase subunit II